MPATLIWLVGVGTVLGVGLALLWPRRGLLARWGLHSETQQRALAEDALKHLHTCAWGQVTASLPSLAGALWLSPTAAAKLAQQLEAEGWVRTQANGLSLTAAGERLAIEVIRAHRLWERYLADEARMPLRGVHAEAERREHQRSRGALQALDAALGYPATDPHGDPIPTADGRLPSTATQPLTDWPLHTPARITHLEDEPAVIFSQILAEGLHPELVIRVLEADARRLVLSDGERIYTLAPIVAANVFVTPATAAVPEIATQPLTALRPGQQATVHALTEALQGFTRRRLLDLGLTPGVAITAELPSMFNDPVAYRVRGTLIALRREQAEHVLIELS